MTLAGAATIEGARLHGVTLSPFVRKVRAVCAIKSIDYELVNVMPGAAGPEFRAISPLLKVPVWQEGDWSLPDSSVICAYLEDVVPEPSIHPQGTRERARDLFWEEYADTRMVDAGAPIFFQRVVRARIFKEAPDETLVRRHVEEVLPPVLDQLQALFIESGDSDPTQATLGAISVWSTFVNLDHAGYELDRARWSALAEFLDAFGARDELARLVEEERSALPSP